MKTQLLIPAAGAGRRMGCGMPKALIHLAGRPMLAWTLTRFIPLGLAQGAVIIVPPGDENRFADALAPFVPEMSFVFATGGAERQESVSRGLDALDVDTALVAIHDAARPFPPLTAIQDSIIEAAIHGAATVAIPSVDTILLGDEKGMLVDTPDRNRLWACQTPQTFRLDVIRFAHAYARNHTVQATDDATLVRLMGGAVKLVPGSPCNIKVTTPEDASYAAYLIQTGAV